MKRILAIAATWGLSPFWFYVILISIVIAGCGLLFGYCNSGGGEKPVPPVDHVLIEEMNSQDKAKKEAAVEKAFEQTNAVTTLSDEKRAEIKREVLNDTKFGKRVDANDFRDLIKKAQEEQNQQ